MRTISWLLLGLFVGLRAPVAGADSPLTRIRIQSAGGAFDDGKPALALSILNISGEDVWVRARFEAPAEPPCEVTKRLLPRYQVRFACEQAGLKPDQDYPVQLTVAGSEDLAQVLEAGRSAVRIEAKTLERLERDSAAAMKRKAAEQAKAALAWQIPRTFQSMTVTDRLVANALGNTLFPFALTQAGNLTVQADAVEYASSKKTLRIPLDSIQSVDLYPPGAVMGQWVVVSYTESGEARRVGFKEKTINPTPEILLAIKSSIGYAKCLREAGLAPGQTIPGRSRLNPVGQCGVYTLLRAAEKAAAPSCVELKVADSETVRGSGDAFYPEVPGQERIERWQLDRCGTPVTYRIRMGRDKSGKPTLDLGLESSPD